MPATLSRYAQTIFDLCKEKGWLDAVYQDFKSVLNLIRVSDDFSSFLLNPSDDFNKRQKAIKSIFEGKLNEVTYRFVLFLEEKKHLYLLSDICGKFIALYQEHKNVLNVTISSSSLLTEQQISNICHHLKLKFRKEIEADYYIDPHILGGFKLTIGDTVYDYTFNTQLKRFKDNLLRV